MDRLENIIVERNDIKRVADILKDFWERKEAMFTRTEDEINIEKRESDEFRRKQYQSDKFDDEKYQFKQHTNKRGSSEFTFDVTMKDRSTESRINYNSAMNYLNDASHLITRFSVDMRISYDKTYREDDYNYSQGNRVTLDVTVNFAEDTVYYTFRSENDNQDEMVRLKREIIDVFNAMKPRYCSVVRNRGTIRYVHGIKYGAVGACLLAVVLLFALSLTDAIDLRLIDGLLIFSAAFFIGALGLAAVVPSPTLDKLYKKLIPRQQYYYNEKSRSSGYVDDKKDFESQCEVMIGENADNAGKREKIQHIYTKDKKSAFLSMVIGFVIVVVTALILGVI